MRSGIQVDGGSEFMAEFEQVCKDNALALFVLPPKRPDLNGAVERAQSSWRYEFYAGHDLPRQLDRLNEHIDAFQTLQPLPTPRRPWRQNPKRVSHPHEPGGPVVSNVVNPDTCLHPPAAGNSIA